MMDSVLVKYGEIAIRGKNREKYELMLMERIKQTLSCNYNVKREQGRFLVEHLDGSMDIDFVVSKTTKVLGVHSVCPSMKINTMNLNEIYEAVVNYVKKYYNDGDYTFKIKTKRADKRYEKTSDQISADIGALVIRSCRNMSVDVRNPNVTIHIELRNYAYVYSKEFKGYGGLPVSSSGKAVYLLSGGIDSPVSSFLMGKRGVYGEFIYFHTPPYVGSSVRQKVIDLSNKVSEYIGPTKLHIVNYTDIAEYLRSNVPEDKITVFMKRNMLAIAEMLAERERMMAIVVGDSVGQVASQTLTAINAIDSAATMPVIRPLSGMNKQETIDLAKQLGTYEISVQPYEDCCTVFTPKHPETRPKKSVIEAIERSLTELATLRKAAYENVETLCVGKAHN